MTEVEKFEAYIRSVHANKEYADSILEKSVNGFYPVTRIQGAWEGWQAALAASAPKVQMTDAEIVEIATTTRTAEPNKDGGYILPISFARAILARSAPNAELVAALRKIIEMNVQYAIDCYGDAKKADTMACVTTARAALAAVGEA